MFLNISSVNCKRIQIFKNLIEKEADPVSEVELKSFIELERVMSL